MARILVTGSNGQLGKCLVERLKNQVDLLALDRQQLDITDIEAVNHIIQQFEPDVVINAAAYTAVDKAESDQEMASLVNVDGVRNLAIACEEISAVLLHISTDYVFDGNKNLESLYTEEDEVNPQSIYGKTKLQGEIVAQKYCKKTIILRTAWVFCEYGNNFVKTMLRLAQSHRELGIVADQFGAPTYAGDIADTLISIVDKIRIHQSIQYGIYHFTGYPYVSWYEFAEAIFLEAKKYNVLNTIPKLNAIKTIDYPTPAKRPANSKLNMDKIKEEFNIAPSNWQKALKNIQSYV
ncbi:dTDP-4-dehydrorhamnose reductase [Gallibacterium anatis]|uniref:dTDP-4-dehydrorhamnose reductase n=1 Tax=Gallibacterium anatis TaxID=750 RepID=UPI0030047C3E